MSLLARVSKCVVAEPLSHLEKGVMPKLLMGVLSPEIAQGVERLTISLRASVYLRARGSGSRRCLTRGRRLLPCSVSIGLWERGLSSFSRSCVARLDRCRLADLSSRCLLSGWLPLATRKE